MRKYRIIASVEWQVQLAYRLHFVLEATASLITTFVTILFWTVIYRGNPGRSLSGYSFPEIMTYLIGAWAINNLALSSQADAIDNDIRQGKLSNDLLKPMSPFLIWFLQDISRKTLFFLIASAAYLTLGIAYRNLLLPPVSAAAFFLCLVAVLFAVMLHFLLFSVFGLLAFWMESTWGIRFAVRTAFEVASGAIIPLPFFPDAWRMIFKALPFQYLASFPLELYLGKTVFTGGFLLELSWIAALLVLCTILWRTGLRHYTAVGR